MVGLPGTRAIHPKWSEHHQPSVASSFRSRVDVLVPIGDLPGRPPLGEPTPEYDPIHKRDVSARIVALSQSDTVAPSEQHRDMQEYLVQLPVSSLPEALVGPAGHRLKITESPETPWLVGRTMTIHADLSGTEAFNRDLMCRIHVTQEQ